VSSLALEGDFMIDHPLETGYSTALAIYKDGRTLKTKLRWFDMVKLISVKSLSTKYQETIILGF
jgi:hypothetical protein